MKIISRREWFRRFCKMLPVLALGLFPQMFCMIKKGMYTKGRGAPIKIWLTGYPYISKDHVHSVKDLVYTHRTILIFG